MARRKFNPETSIPPPWFVRTFAVFLLAFDIAVITLTVINFEQIGWIAYPLLIGTAVSVYFPLMALKTGNPEWVLLDLILPGF